MKKKQKVTLEGAVKLLNEHYGMPEGRNAFAKGTISNYISEKKLKRYGPKSCVLLDPEEVIQVLGEKNSA